CAATRCAASCSGSSARPSRWADVAAASEARAAGRRSGADGQRGSVTAELALLLPAVVVVLLVCTTLGAAVLGQVRCADAARAAARAAAIGEPASVVQAVARDLAGPDSSEERRVGKEGVRRP